MVDNVTLPATGQIIRTVEIGGIDTQVCILADGTTGLVVGTTNLTNGRGLNVVVLSESACKGVDLIGDDLTGALPLYLGAYACTSLSNGAYQTDNRMQALKVTGDGVLLTRPWTTPEEQIPTTPVTLTGTGDTALIGAVASDKKAALIGAACINLSAVDTTVIFKVSGNAVWEVPVPRLGGPTPPVLWSLPIRSTVNVGITAALRIAAAAGVVVYPLAFQTKG